MPCRLNGMERDLAVLRAFEEGQWSIQEQLAGEDSIPTEVLTGALTALNGLLRASELRGEPEAPPAPRTYAPDEKCWCGEPLLLVKRGDICSLGRHDD